MELLFFIDCMGYCRFVIDGFPVILIFSELTQIFDEGISDCELDEENYRRPTSIWHRKECSVLWESVRAEAEIT